MLGGRMGDDATGTDMISSIQTRLSMQARRSSLDPRRLSLGSNHHHGDRDGLIRAFDEEEAAGFGLTDLAEDSEEDRPGRNARGKANGSAGTNGHAAGAPAAAARSSADNRAKNQP